MKLASVKEAREIDARTQSEYGISSADLIDRAGRLSAARLFAAYAEFLEAPNFAVVLCGPGNNGADGLVCASALRELGVRVEVVSLSDLKSASDLEALGKKIRDCSVVVDALFGIGLNREIESTAREVIQRVNESSAKRVSLDTPSGLDSETGVVLGEAVMADLTLTFGVAKRGFAVNEGPRHLGRLEVLDIGFPIELVKRVASTTIGFDRKLIRKFLPRRHSSGNKSSYGRVQIFAGSAGMGGAAMLAGSAAARSGAGYVVVTTNGRPKDVLAEAPEFMTATLDDARVFEKPKWTAAIIGPGLGDKAGEVIRRVRDASDSPTVLDADGLSALAKSTAGLKLPPNWILTPHAGELSRLIGVDAKTIEGDRFRYAEEAAKKFGCLVLLKGFRTVVSNGQRAVVILAGNPALAKAGMGDVLSGMIGGFLAQGLKPFTAACLGAAVHGHLADEWVRSGRDVLSFQPSDLSASLPFVLKSLRGLK